jgi:hypothetical protein
MAIPQFTGELSLYKSSNQFMSVSVGLLAHSAAIPQQLPTVCSRCERFPHLCTPRQLCICGGCIWSATPHPHCICI